jgi:hypothetical protein
MERVSQMVRIIPENERRRMSEAEIIKEYDGKWLFMIQVEIDPLYVVPVVVADEWWEGHETDLYESIKNDRSSGPTMHMSLLKDLTVMVGQY